MIITNGARGTRQVRDKNGRIVTNLPASPTPLPAAPAAPVPGPVGDAGGEEASSPIGDAYLALEETNLGGGAAATDNVLTHEGTAVVTALALAEHPRLSPLVVSLTVQELYEEAVAAGLESDPIPVSGVYSWIDSQTFHVLSRFPPHAHEELLGQLRSMADEYSERRAGYITPAHIYAWKHTAHVAHAKMERQSLADAKTIAVDVDGVLYDVDTVMWRWLTNKGYAPPTHEIRTYNMSENWGIDEGTIQEEFGSAVSAGVMFRYGDPYPEGLDAVRRIYGAGHEVVLVTARDLPGKENQCLQATIKWLRENRIPFDSLYLTREKEKIPFDVLVDDAPGNVERVTAWGKKGIILHRPWNRDEGEGYARGTWMDILNTLDLVPAMVGGEQNPAGFIPSKVARTQTRDSSEVQQNVTAKHRSVTPA